MAKLFFHWGSMDAGKSTLLLQTQHNYRVKGMECLLLTAALDTRSGEGRIASRLGLESVAETFAPDEDLFEKIMVPAAQAKVAAVLCDEAHFLSPQQVMQLARGVDELKVPVLAYGLRTDFRLQAFPGSAALLAVADVIREMRSICDCGRAATAVLRFDETGNPVFTGPQVQIGGNSTYKSVCRKHWFEALREHEEQEAPVH
ncbi:thymidine kinase [Sulfitobacter brevis]|uniref:Thymidine kinase n=1 Tax=Sulfitobacter brevis TaxID=74348 RepID=A0A1I1SZA0_9RHOB|nr:thymidine kinase [Sulfitobacter brevis]SFD51779.1 thymidine kinase [Sulfitobacter brevis]